MTSDTPQPRKKPERRGSVKESSRNIWYAKYPADMAKKTKHLSLAERGAYETMLDHYYLTEKPLPLSIVQMHRVCNALAPSEQEAVDNVLAEFFTKTADGWRNKRADEELEKRREISRKRAEAQAAMVEARKGKLTRASASYLHLHPHSKESFIRESSSSTAREGGFKKLGDLGAGAGINLFSLRRWLDEPQNEAAATALMRKLLETAPSYDRNAVIAEYDRTASTRKGIPTNPPQAFFGWLRKVYLKGKKP